MIGRVASRTMPRTTLDLDASVLAALRARQAVEGKSLGRLASELLAQVLDEAPAAPGALEWAAKPMQARVDLDDRDAVEAAMAER